MINLRSSRTCRLSLLAAAGILCLCSGCSTYSRGGLLSSQHGVDTDRPVGTDHTITLERSPSQHDPVAVFRVDETPLYEETSLQTYSKLKRKPLSMGLLSAAVCGVAAFVVPDNAEDEEGNPLTDQEKKNARGFLLGVAGAFAIGSFVAAEKVPTTETITELKRIPGSVARGTPRPASGVPIDVVGDTGSHFTMRTDASGALRIELIDSGLMDATYPPGADVVLALGLPDGDIERTRIPAESFLSRYVEVGSSGAEVRLTSGGTRRSPPGEILSVLSRAGSDLLVSAGGSEGLMAAREGASFLAGDDYLLSDNPPDLVVAAHLVGVGGEDQGGWLEAYGTARLDVETDNSGRSSGRNVHQQIECEWPGLTVTPSSKSLGEIRTGKSASSTYEIRAEPDVKPGTARLTVVTDEGRGYDAADVVVEVPIARFRAPKLSIARLGFQDGGSGLAAGDGDGIIENGEVIEFTAVITNEGEGPAYGVGAELSADLSGPRVSGARNSWPMMMPGQSETARFGVEIPRVFLSASLPVTVRVTEERGVGEASYREDYEVDVASPALEVSALLPAVVTNGERASIMLETRNRGSLAASNAALRAIPPRGITASQTAWTIGAVPSGGDASPVQLLVDIPRAYRGDVITIPIRITQDGFPEATTEIDVPVTVREPELEIDGRLASGESVTLGAGFELAFEVYNRGDLAAENVTVQASAHYGDYHKTDAEIVGKVRSGKSYTGKFTFPPLKRGLEPGTMRISLQATQTDFGEASTSVGCVVTDESPSVVAAERSEIEPIVTGFASILTQAGSGADAPDPTGNVDIPLRSRTATVNGHAVVIGVSKYGSRSIGGVDYAARDARTVRDYLSATLGYPNENITLLLDEKATLTDIKTAIEGQLPRQVNSARDEVFVFFSGHGYPDMGTEDEERRAVLAPYDFREEYAGHTGYRVTELLSHLSELPARRITVVMDACFSGASDAASGDPRSLVHGVSPMNVVYTPPTTGTTQRVSILTASGAGEVAAWYPAEEHGLFTYYLLRGLRGGADDDGDGTIRFGEMCGFLSREVPVAALSIRGIMQHPHFSGGDPEWVMVEY